MPTPTDLFLMRIAPWNGLHVISGAPGKSWQNVWHELGGPVVQHLWESDEAVAAMTRVMIVKRRASA